MAGFLTTYFEADLEKGFREGGGEEDTVDKFVKLNVT